MAKANLWPFSLYAPIMENKVRIIDIHSVKQYFLSLQTYTVNKTVSKRIVYCYYLKEKYEYNANVCFDFPFEKTTWLTMHYTNTIEKLNLDIYIYS